jgi:osmoprotectant transport system ATP-binding protein
MLQLRDISKRYTTKQHGTLQALDTVSLEVEPERTTVLLGTSGCGKSTLLRVALGLVTPDSGAVRLYGEPLGRDNLLAMRRRIGYVVQHGGLFPHLSGRANVTLVARHLAWGRERIAARLSELSELVQLPAALLERRPAAMSGGQQQRVGLMRALFLDPPLLLLDEPLGALDPLVRAQLQQELRAIFARLGKTVVLVTHDLREAEWFGDQIVLMHQGQIVQRGTFEDLLERPASDYVRRFVAAQRGPAAPRGAQQQEAS